MEVISCRGWITPVSLLASITEISEGLVRRENISSNRVTMMFMFHMKGIGEIPIFRTIDIK